jgi:hypothetical protein
MGKFGAIKSVRLEQLAEPQQSSVENPDANTLPQPTPISTKGRPTGKRSNPEYEPTTVFLRKATKRTANRALEDAGIRQDLSELIEDLLQVWISEHANM